MLSEESPKDIVTILYEVGGQQYVIGVTNEEIPVIAVMGVNTTRPLPQNIKRAFVASVKDLKQMKETPEVIDYNAPSQQLSRSILGNLNLAPPSVTERPAKTVEEAVTELEAKMQGEGK